MLMMAEFPDFSPHLFDDSEVQIESSARFPEINATDLLEISLIMQIHNTVVTEYSRDNVHDTQYCHHERTD